MGRRADLSPPLGNPGGPCHLIQRIKDEVDNQKVEDLLVDRVWKNKELDNSAAAEVYDLEVESGAGMIQKMVIGPHAAYRMDLRGVTVEKLRAALAAFSKQFQDWKAQKSFEYDDHVDSLSRGEPINWYDKKTNLEVVFVANGPAAVKIVTTYFKGKPDPKARPGQCVVAYSPPAGDLFGYQTYVEHAMPDRAPNEPAGEGDGSDERAADSEKQQVLPSPPWSRSKPSGKPALNVPPGSDNALDGKSLSIDRARTLGTPGGDEHPWVDNSTGYHQVRPGLAASVKGPQYPGTHKQHDQAGVVERYYKKYYKKNKGKILRRTKLWEKHNQHNQAYKKDKARREKTPERFERQSPKYREPGDRQKDWREKQAFDTSVQAVSDRWADMLYEKRPPEMEPDQHFDRANTLPTAPRHKHTPAPDFGQVWDSNGSGKVIPEGHGFENKNDRTFKEAAFISELLDKTSASVQTKADGMTIKLKRVDAANKMWMFEVPGSDGTHQIKIKALPRGNVLAMGKVDVQVSCSCPFWRWQGPEHFARQGDYLYGNPVGTASKPVVKDPEGKNWLCKHAVAVLRKVQTYALKPTAPKGKTASLQALADILLADKVWPEGME